MLVNCACNWKEATYNNKAFGALLTDLLKAFNCLNHVLFITKLHAYGLMKGFKRLIRKHRREPKNEKALGWFMHLWEKEETPWKSSVEAYSDEIIIFRGLVEWQNFILQKLFPSKKLAILEIITICIFF